MGKDNLIARLSLDFALRIVKLKKYLAEEKHENVLSKQILRSGTSIGANLYESEHAQSTADFLSKLYIALKEANETKYWLILLFKSDYLNEEQYDSIINDLQTIIGTLVNIIKKTKSNNNIK